MLFFVIFPLLFTLSYTSFNFEELKNTHYGIEILQNPVALSEELNAVGSSSLTVTSIHGQTYQCSHPDTMAEEEREKEQERQAMETGVTELLKPLGESSCLTYTKGWWTYELCYGASIKQFHMEGGQVSGTLIQLGLYESDYNWDKDELSSKKAGRKKSRYHSQEYVNGSLCDLTQKPRSTQVRYFCVEGAHDFIERIDEPETCVYVLHVHTPRLCHHPAFKPPVIAKPVPVTCQPLLSEQEYTEYTLQKQIHEEEVLRQEQILEQSMELKKARRNDEEYSLVDGRLVRMRSNHGDGARDFDVSESLFDDDDLAALMSETLEKALSEVLGESMGDLLGDAGADMKLNVHVFKDYSDEENDVTEEGDVTEQQSRGPHTSLEKKEAELEDEDAELMEEFEKELDSLKNRDRTAQHRDSIESAMNSKFTEILQEAGQELAEEGVEGEVDQTAAIQQLGKTLTKLLDKLDQAQQDLDNADSLLTEKIEERENQLHSLKKELENSVTQGDSANQPSQDKSEVQIQDDDTNTDVTSQSHETTKSTRDSSTHSKKNVIENSLRNSRESLRSRIQKATDTFKQNKNKNALQSSSKGAVQKEENTDSSSRTTTINEKPKPSVKDKSQNVEIQVIRSGYIDKDGELHMNDEEEGDGSLSQMIVAVLGRGGAENKEAERQQQLEDGYNFHWSNDDKRNKRSNAPKL